MEKILTKLAFSFDQDDKALLDKAKDQLRPTHGSLSNMAVIRMALRALVK